MSAKEDLERTLELKARVWAYVARNLLKGAKNPYEIETRDVESHANRIDKAIRLLGNILSVARTEKQAYGKPKVFYTVGHFEESKELAVYPKYIQTWQAFHSDIFGSYFDTLQEYETSGYRLTDHSMDHTAVLYIYWHQDEFDTTVYEEHTYYYPKDLKEIRIKAMLRAVVEHHFQADFPKKLEKYLGLPEESLRTEGEFKIEPRNFSAYAASFTDLMYTGAAGYLEEYTHYRDYFEGLLRHLHTIDQLVKEKGGHAAIVRDMRIDSTQQLLLSAPLCINFVRPEDDKFSVESRDNVLKKCCSLFILKHSNYFDYDILYDTDTSISHIQDSRVTDMTDSLLRFNPDEDITKVVEDYRKGRQQCLAQMISAI